MYAIPYVDALHVFEMPLLGYAGYLPFGVLCAEIGDLIVGEPGRAPYVQVPGTFRARFFSNGAHD